MQHTRPSSPALALLASDERLLMLATSEFATTETLVPEAGIEPARLQ